MLVPSKDFDKLFELVRGSLDWKLDSEAGFYYVDNCVDMSHLNKVPNISLTLGRTAWLLKAQNFISFDNQNRCYLDFYNFTGIGLNNWVLGQDIFRGRTLIFNFDNKTLGVEVDHIAPGPDPDPDPEPEPEEAEGSGLSAGAKAAIAIVVILAVLGMGGYCYYRWKKARSSYQVLMD